MIKFSDCDFCKHCRGVKDGHPICDAFPEGVPYEHMDKDLRSTKKCNNSVGFEKNNDQLYCSDTVAVATLPLKDKEGDYVNGGRK